jgi:hypothetical protein
VARYEHGKARGLCRDLTLNDALFLTFESRDAVNAAKQQDLGLKREQAFQERLIAAKVGELEAKLAQLLQQKDVMRRHGKGRHIRSACRLAPRSADIGLHAQGSEPWNPEISALWSPAQHRWQQTDGPVRDPSRGPEVAPESPAVETYLGSTRAPLGSTQAPREAPGVGA